MQSPAAGRTRAVNRLRARLAETALEAAGCQHTRLSGEKPAAQTVLTLARQVRAPNQQVAEVDWIPVSYDRPMKRPARSDPGIRKRIGVRLVAESRMPEPMG
ncbi:hypothetical protein Sfulv_60050 [Streptomyces fulvorobeus]|uniref:Uncharacterized protein n=1 Tax=Streptomyces fulvorobeus TaxID=284028 RepID=A0A7J0CHD3_9ACTN|nr:hypothetical protein [Streptomyces fulvorobeus]GFN01195.1 hypothetical protein Sfulv_60050 [Streptomyces fulvorobeus]